MQTAYFANAVSGLMTGQEMIRGQAALRYTGLLGIPIFNVENACASAASAFHLAWMAVGVWAVRRRARHRRREAVPRGQDQGVPRHRHRGGPRIAAGPQEEDGRDDQGRRQAGRRKSRPEPILLHGHLRVDDPRIHAAERRYRGGLRRRRGQEPRARRAESQGAISQPLHSRRGARLARDLPAPDPDDVLADRRRRRGGDPLLGESSPQTRRAAGGSDSRLGAGLGHGPQGGRARRRRARCKARVRSRPASDRKRST